MAFKRTEELKHLQNYYNRNENQIVVMYGKKYNGKSDLIKEFVKGKEYFYYKARACSVTEQIMLWQEEIRDELPKNTKLEPGFSGIISALINQKVDKRVIIIDEFQNIIKFDTSFMETLIHAAHNKWNYQPIMFLLCSSANSWIENSMVDKLKEMAFEISGLLKLNELKFSNLKTNFKSYSFNEQLQTYSIIGGFPDIWKKWDEKKPVSENICRLILREGSSLYEYGQSILPDELREPVVYNTILVTLAEGKNKLNEIYKHTGFSRPKISVYLKNLIELEIVEKIDSYNTAGYDNAQKGIYKIKSPFVNFWFRFIFKNQSKLLFMSPEKFYAKYISKELNSYVAKYYSKVCCEYLDEMNQNDKLKFRYTTRGVWLGKVGVIDCVAENDTGKVLISLANYEKSSMTYADYEWLMFCAKQAKIIPDAIYLFSVGDFDMELKQEAMLNENVILKTLNS